LHLAANDIAGTKDLSDALGLGRQLIKMHLASLEESGLIRETVGYASDPRVLTDEGRRFMFDRGWLK
jgi:DNA-binding MarR family transcriptional regulator